MGKILNVLGRESGEEGEGGDGIAGGERRTKDWKVGTSRKISLARKALQGCLKKKKAPADAESAQGG